MTETKRVTEVESDCTEVLEGNKSIILDLISQLGKDMSLHKITLPVFVLEPRSMLERITDFMSHPDILLNANKEPKPLDRFIGVVKYFLSGWHIKPKGVKKPYNPILGEIFKCQWVYNDGSEGIYISEQVNHSDPAPCSAYYFANPNHGIYAHGEIHPKSKFLGNSVATIMEGESTLQFHHHDNETYEFTMPNIHTKGILFGKMTMDLNDKCIIRCNERDLICEINFTSKGFFGGGQDNSIDGKIKKQSTGEALYDIFGQWSSQIYIKSKSTEKKLFFDALSTPIHPKIVELESKQGPLESRKVWSQLTLALKNKDLDEATHQKFIIEDGQRNKAKERQEIGEVWTPSYFVKNKKGKYRYKDHSSIDVTNPKETMDNLKSSIF
ncbi:unnamed protein product [Cunninghamella blakesleeana]